MLLMLVGSLLLGGCASGGPKHAEIRESLARPDPGMGRIYFYRDQNIVGAAIQPDIRLNREVVGSSRPGGFFFVDRPQGKYLVSVTTEVENTIEFALAAGETRYVRTHISIGILVGRAYPLLVDPEQASAALGSLSYIGDPSLLARIPGPSGTEAAGKPRSGVTMGDLRDLLPDEKTEGKSSSRPTAGLEDLKHLLPAGSRP